MAEQSLNSHLRLPHVHRTASRPQRLEDGSLNDAVSEAQRG